MKGQQGALALAINYFPTFQILLEISSTVVCPYVATAALSRK